MNDRTSSRSISADRAYAMLQSAMGPDIAAALADPLTQEAMVNPDGRLRIDRLGEGCTDTGVTIAASQSERIIRLVASHIRAEVTRESPIVSAELPPHGDTTSGSGANRRTHILVKPSAPGLKTNLVISTDRRVYHLALESTERTAMAALSWNYPQDELMAIERATADIEAQRPIAEGLALDRLNFDYRISGDDPVWRPLRAFDDGRQTFIAFPARISDGEAPPLFVTGAKGAAQLVNYRMRGDYYVVDRLFEAAELRLGEKNQDVVRITRGGKKHSRNKEKGS